MHTVIRHTEKDKSFNLNSTIYFLYNLEQVVYIWSIGVVIISASIFVDINAKKIEFISLLSFVISNSIWLTVFLSHISISQLTNWLIDLLSHLSIHCGGGGETPSCSWPLFMFCVFPHIFSPNSHGSVIAFSTHSPQKKDWRSWKQISHCSSSTLNFRRVFVSPWF